MNTVKPNVPGIIDVGGLHITPPKPLPADLQKFLDETAFGVIYFSFGKHTIFLFYFRHVIFNKNVSTGSQVKSSEMPAAQLKAFISVFKEFSHVKILWKWESDNIEEIPKNVMVKKWLPQNDILAHPNVRLFITHGGLLGGQEGIHYGVPMLGIPFFGDQKLNTNKAVVSGYALKLDFNNITVDSLRWSINELLDNPKYYRKAQEFSKIFRDRPESAIDRAMYWIEYVIRHRGAHHLRSGALDLPWFSYFLLDIVAAVTLIVLLSFLTVRFVVKRVIGGGKKITKAKLNSKKKKQ